MGAKEMTQMTYIDKKPPIIVRESDHDRLWKLAAPLHERADDVPDQLLSELDRAEIVPDDKIPHGVITMGARLRYETDNGEKRSVVLVFPNEADIAQGRVSILTPIGVALLGLSAGQSIQWRTLNGAERHLTILSVCGPGN